MALENARGRLVCGLGLDQIQRCPRLHVQVGGVLRARCHEFGVFGAVGFGAGRVCVHCRDLVGHRDFGGGIAQIDLGIDHRHDGVLHMVDLVHRDVRPLRHQRNCGCVGGSGGDRQPVRVGMRLFWQRHPFDRLPELSQGCRVALFGVPHCLVRLSWADSPEHGASRNRHVRRRAGGHLPLWRVDVGVELPRPVPRLEFDCRRGCEAPLEPPLERVGHGRCCGCGDGRGAVLDLVAPSIEGLPALCGGRERGEEPHVGRGAGARGSQIRQRDPVSPP